MKYMKIDLSTINGGGIDHQLSNFRTIIQYCYQNKLKLIKPIFILTGFHNYKKVVHTDLSDYFDLNNIKVNEEKFELYDDNDEMEYTVKKKIYKGQLLINDDMFKNMKTFTLNMSPTDEIMNIARQISLKLNNNYMCVHVRRGDLVRNEQIDLDTQPDNIQKVISKYNPESTYIMTNKIDEIKALRANKNLYFYTDFELLKNITDNYYLYIIEKTIMKSAKIKCSTFNIKLTYKNHDYYDCYLTNQTRT